MTNYEAGRTIARRNAKALTAEEIGMVSGGIHVTSVSLTLSLTGPDVSVSIDPN